MRNLLFVNMRHQHDVLTKDEDLIPLAMTAVRRLEKTNFN